MTEVVILGAGNVATHLFHAFMANNAVKLKQVFNHKPESLSAFKGQVATTTAIEEISKADFYIFALKDDVIAKVANKLKGKDGMMLHTSGAKEMEVFSGFRNYGVFYPLQTFSRNKVVNFKEIPLCLEANNASNLQKLWKFASLISGNLYEINSKQRRALHLAAVFVNNFTNHMYSLGADICQENRVSFDILKPLIRETASKIEILSPAEAQTGPALRDDRKTIAEHLSLLNQEQIKIYELLTSSIQEFYGKKL